MPDEIERRLKKEAYQKFPGRSKEARRKRDRYVYGTLRKMGWKPKRERNN